MTGVNGNGNHPSGINFELASARRIQGPELLERLADGYGSGCYFVAMLKNGSDVVRKRSEVKAVRPTIADSGIFAVRFEIEDPRPGLDKTVSEAYFQDGFYRRELKTDKLLRLSDEDRRGVAVVSGILVPVPSGDDDKLLLDSRSGATGIERTL